MACSPHHRGPFFCRDGAKQQCDACGKIVTDRQVLAASRYYLGCADITAEEAQGIQIEQSARRMRER